MGDCHFQPGDDVEVTLRKEASFVSTGREKLHSSSHPEHSKSSSTRAPQAAGLRRTSAHASCGSSSNDASEQVSPSDEPS